MRVNTPIVTPEQKATKQLSTLFRLFQYFKPYRNHIPIALGFVLIGAATQAIGPFLIGWSIDNYIRRGDVRGLMQMLLLLAAIYIIGVLAIREQIYRIGTIMQRTLAQLRQDIFIKIQSLPISFFDRSEAGDLMSRLINDVSTVNQAFGQTVAQMLGQLFTLTGIIIAMLSIDLRLGLISNLIIPLMLITTGLFSRWARARFRITRQTISEMSIKLEEDIGGVREAQAFTRAPLNIREFMVLNAANRDANVQAVAITSAFLPSIDLLNTLATAAVLAANAGTPNAIVDWVFVELRSTTDSANVLITRSALLQRDGDVVSAADGTSMLVFTGIVGQSYFVSVKHRNHLGAMTAARVVMNNDSTLVDFINATNAQVYDRPGSTNYNGMEQVTFQTKRALWAGNANVNTKVKYQGTANDNTIVLTQVLGYPTNILSTYNFNLAFGYFNGDINMDGKVKYQGSTNDASLIFSNVIGQYNSLNTIGLYNYDLFLEQTPN